MKKTGFAKIKFIRIAPSKIKKILDTIRGKSYLNAIKLLYNIPQKSGVSIFKGLKSAVSNACHNNNNLKKEKLYISEAYVTQGPILKRLHARAKGKSAKIEKKMCHISFFIEEKENLN
jgi:large subunit ribosomal protein L22